MLQLPDPRNTQGWEHAVQAGAGTWQHEWAREALVLARKATIICVAFSPAGYWTLGLLTAQGQWLVSPQVDILVAAVGLAEAATWLVRAAMRVRKDGSMVGPALDAGSMKFWQDEIGDQDPM
mgnify:CR=1 FL=1